MKFKVGDHIRLIEGSFIDIEKITRIEERSYRFIYTHPSRGDGLVEHFGATRWFNQMELDVVSMISEQFNKDLKALLGDE